MQVYIYMCMFIMKFTMTFIISSIMTFSLTFNRFATSAQVGDGSAPLSLSWSSSPEHLFDRALYPKVFRQKSFRSFLIE